MQTEPENTFIDGLISEKAKVTENIKFLQERIKSDQSEMFKNINKLDHINGLLEEYPQAEQHYDVLTYANGHSNGNISNNYISTDEQHIYTQRFVYPNSRKAQQKDINDFKDEIINILQDKGEPMRIDEIMKALDIKGIPLPGSGTPANVTVRIRRATNDDGTKVFNRTNPGTYALNEDTPRWKKFKPLKDVRKRKKSRK